MGLRPQCPPHQIGGLTMKIETYEATRGMHKFLEPPDLLLSFARAFYDSLTLFRDGWNASCGSVFAVSPLFTDFPAQGVDLQIVGQLTKHFFNWGLKGCGVNLNAK